VIKQENKKMKAEIESIEKIMRNRETPLEDVLEAEREPRREVKVTASRIQSP
jgi:hypothetical protein